MTSPAFKSLASPDFHHTQDHQKQPLYVPVPTSPPPTTQGSINAILRRLFPRLIVNVSPKPIVDRSPPPIVPLPKPPAIGPRHFCPPLPRKRSTPSGTWRPPSRIPNPEPPPPSRLRPHTRTPPSAIPPPEQISLPARPPSRLHPLPDWAAAAREMRAMPPSPPALPARGLVPLVARWMLHPPT